VAVAREAEEIIGVIENAYDDALSDDSTSKTSTRESTGRGLPSEGAMIVFGGDMGRLGGESWGIAGDVNGL
jgi:hypothetical protein